MAKAIKTQIVLNSIRSRKDKSVGFSGETPELSNSERNIFFDLQGINSEILIKPLDEKIDEVVKVDKNLDTKTQGQRMRSVIFILWKQSGEKETFETFYNNKTEKIINYLKDQIDN